MATLAFEVNADYEKVIRLRDEVARLQQALNALQGNGSQQAIATLESQLRTAQDEFRATVAAAATLGTSIAQSVQKVQLGTVEEQMNALAYAIHENETALAAGAQQLQRWREEGDKALAAGDSERVAMLTASITEQVTALRAVQQQTDGYRAALDALAAGNVDTSLEGVTRTVRQLDAACDTHRAAIEQLEGEYTRLCSTLGTTVAEESAEEQSVQARLQTIRGEVTVRRSLIKEIQEQATTLEAHITATRQETAQVEQTTQAHESLRSKIRQLREEMAALRMQGIDEQSEAYRRLSAELGRLQDVQSDISRQGSILANDQQQFAGLQSGIQGVTGAFMGAQSAIGLFCGANKTLQEVLVRSHYLMSITNSLQQVAAALNKDSAFRLVTLAKARDYWNKLLAIGRGEQVADTTATVAATVAKEAATAAETKNTAATGANTAAAVANTGAAVAQTTATIGLAGAFRMLGAAIRSVPVFGWIIAGIAALTAGIVSLAKRTSEAREKMLELGKSIAEAVYKPVGIVKQLSYEWGKLGDNIKAKEKYVKDNEERFRELGVAVKSVDDAEKLFRNNAQAFIDAQIAKAKATIYLDKVLNNEKRLMEIENELEHTEQYSTRVIAGGNTGATQTIQVENKQWKKLNKEREKLLNENAGYNEQITAQYQKVAALQGQYAPAATTTDNTTSTATINSDLATQTARYKELVEKQGKERAREVTQMEVAVRQAQIDAMADSNAKTLAQIALTFEEQEVAIEQWYEDLKDTRIAKEKELWEANPANKGKNFDENAAGFAYTPEEQQLYEEQLKANQRKREAAIADIYKAEGDALRAFLKDYGTYEERRVALAEEYAAKIAAAQTTGEKMSLSAQRDSALQKLAFEYEDQTNWEVIFSHIDQYSVDYLREIQQKLKDLLASDDITAEQAKSLGDQLDKVNALLYEKSASWRDVLGITSERQRVLNQLLLEQEAAQERLNAAQERYNASLSQTQYLQGDIKDILEGLGVDTTTVDLSAGNAQGILDTAQAAGADDTTIAYLKDAVAALGATTATTNALAQEVQKDAAAVEANTKAIEGSQEKTKEERTESAVKTAQQVAQGLSLAGDLSDMLGLDEGIGQTFHDLSAGVTSSVDAFEKFTSGDYVGAAASAISAVTSFGDAFGSLFGFGETDKTLHDDMEALSYSNDALKASINELSGEISKLTTSLTDAAQDYATAMYNLEKMEQDTQEIMQRAGISHSNAWFSSDHSSDYYINDNMTAEDWRKISAAAGTTVRSAGDFWRLTSEQMYNVSVQEAALYAKIKQHADDGHDDVAQYMDEYIGYYQQLLDLQDEWNEKLTATSLDSLVSSFQSAIMDMGHTSADFANDFEELMKNAVVSSLVSSKYADMLSDWYDEFAAAMKNDYMISTTEQEKLREEYGDIVDAATDEIEQLYKMMGWSTTANTQTAQSTAWQTMSEDTGQELNGRFTAMYESLIRHETLSEGLAAQGDLLNDIATNTRDILASSYLELQEIRDNTGLAADYLRVIRNDIAAVRENTERI